MLKLLDACRTAQVLLFREPNVRADHGGSGRALAFFWALLVRDRPNARSLCQCLHRSQCLDDVPSVGRGSAGEVLSATVTLSMPGQFPCSQHDCGHPSWMAA